MNEVIARVESTAPLGIEERTVNAHIAKVMRKVGVVNRIQQGLEINRPSQIFVRASRTGEKITNVRVGGHAMEIIEG